MTTSTKLDRRRDAIICVTAALALERMGHSLAIGINPAQAFAEASNLQRLAERRELVALGYLPGSIGAQPHAVALGVDMVEVEGERDSIAWNLAPKIAEMVADVVQGPHDLWFSRDTGEAYISFELEDDATLFRLALDA